MLSQIFLRSRERAAAVKRESGRCQSCGVKGRPKAIRNGPAVALQVHHLDGGGIDEIMNLIYTRLLCHPSRLQVLCRACHEEIEHLGTCHGRKKTLTPPSSCDTAIPVKQPRTPESNRRDARVGASPLRRGADP